MSSRPSNGRGWPRRAALAAAAAVVLTGAVVSDASARGNPSGEFYVPPPNPGAIAQIKALRSAGRAQDARLIQDLVTTPSAVWFTSGTPGEVRASVAATMQAAARARRVPVLVAYNAPARDCSQYSAGGAADDAAYRAWIDGFAAGVGRGQAVVVVEPDGLALLPSDCGQEPTQDGPITSGRFADIAYAAKKLGALPGARVYLDAGHSGWQSVPAITKRLIRGGVGHADGFALNTSNYRSTSGLQKYGTWISKCLAYTLKQAGAVTDNCASQYSPATVTDESTWSLSDAWYDANVTVKPDAHFVIDTSRNGKGPWAAPAGTPAGADAQVWCNPPDRGAGARPGRRTGNSLNDAFLWVKIPGESDGQCYRWTTGPDDPVRGMADPPAGQWFPEMALELAKNAVPPLR